VRQELERFQLRKRRASAPALAQLSQLSEKSE